MLGNRKSIGSSSLVWSLLKTAALWFILAQGAIGVAHTFDVLPESFVYFAIWAFVLHSVVLFWAALLADGFSRRLFVGIGVGGVLAMGISAMPTSLDDAVLLFQGRASG